MAVGEGGGGVGWRNSSYLIVKSKCHMVGCPQTMISHISVYRIPISSVSNVQKV